MAMERRGLAVAQRIAITPRAESSCRVKGKRLDLTVTRKEDRLKEDRRIKKGKHRTTELGTEKKCNRCKEWWPADDEFFHAGDSRDGLASWCRACISEYSAIRWAQGKHKKAAERRQNYALSAEANS